MAVCAAASSGDIDDAGGRIRVQATGVGAPLSGRIVTAASPIPIEVRSSPRSYT